MSDKSPDKEVLQRFNSEIPVVTVTVLFVGAKGTGKHRVARSLLALQSDKCLTLQIKIASMLPLPKDRESTRSRPNVDYIVFFMNMANKASFKVVEESLKYLSIDYFLGRCSFVASKARSEFHQNVTVREITSLADAYHSPVNCADLELEEDISLLAKKLLCRLEIACGFCNDFTPLFLETTRQCFMYEDS